MDDIWVYDIETYKHCFLFCAEWYKSNRSRIFEISNRKNEVEELLEFLRNVVRHGHRLVGFNNQGFDYPVIHYIMMKSRQSKISGNPLEITSEELYNYGTAIITATDQERWNYIPKPKDVLIPQVDLFKIHHFDNVARSTSLKMLEFNMRSPNIEDLPYAVDAELTSEEMDNLVKYNIHDVKETKKFLKHSLEAIKFREELTEKYGFDCTNFNDTKVGKEYFIRKLEEENPGCCYIYSKGRRTINQTKRDKIEFKGLLFDYLKFDRPEFKALHKWFSEQVITETKGVFTDILESDLGEVAQYANLRMKRQKLFKKPTEEQIAKFKKEKPLCWVDEVQLKSGGISYWLCWNVADTLNLMIDGVQYDYGTGGIHGAVPNTTILSDDEYVIIDADVSSMYPNLAIANRVYPEHLGETFCDIYQEVYLERKKYPKNSPENAVMKLALNGVYGDSNNQYSPLYDPTYTMAITVGGQLSLSMLADMLLKIEDCKIFYLNTDGLTVKIKRNLVDSYYDVCKQWESITKLELEYVEYSAMYQRDVNNYISVLSDGRVKRKGSYEYDGLGWHQNHSALVIPMAAEHEILGRGCSKEFILSHKDEYDFMLRAKVPRNSRLVLDMGNLEIPQQNICRYYPSKSGGKLVKIMPPLKGKEEERRIGVDKEWNVTVCNDMSKFKWDIDYDYYISEARKLIDAVKENQM